MGYLLCTLSQICFSGPTANVTWHAPENNHLIYWVWEKSPQNHTDFHLQNDSVNPRQEKNFKQ